MFKIQLTLRFGREHSPAQADAPEWRESQGSLVEMFPQPRYIGLEAVAPDYVERH